MSMFNELIYFEVVVSIRCSLYVIVYMCNDMILLFYLKCYYWDMKLRLLIDCFYK